MMAYANDFVVAIRKAGSGEVLRDIKGKNGERDVFIPFGSEYEIYVKNKSLYNVAAQVFIDGMDAFGGQKIVIKAGDSTVLKRFMVDGDKDKGKRFKFVSVESGHEGIVDPDSRENGLIQVKFFKEKTYCRQPDVPYVKKGEPIYPPFVPVYPPYVPGCPWEPCSAPYKPYRMTWSGTTGDADSLRYGAENICDENICDCDSGNTRGEMFGMMSKSVDSKTSGTIKNKSWSMSEQTLSCDSGLTRSMNYSCSNIPVKASMSKVGATVEGGTSSQSFREVFMDCESEPVVTISLRMRGNVDAPLSVKDSIHCSECGAKVECKSKFCWKCGAKVTSPCVIGR